MWHISDKKIVVTEDYILTFITLRKYSGVLKVCITIRSNILQAEIQAKENDYKFIIGHVFIKTNFRIFDTKWLNELLCTNKKILKSVDIEKKDLNGIIKAFVISYYCIRYSYLCRLSWF